MIRQLYLLFKQHQRGKVKYSFIYLLMIIIYSQQTINAFVTARFIDGVVQKNSADLFVGFFIGIIGFVTIVTCKYIEVRLKVNLQEHLKLRLRKHFLFVLKSVRLNEIAELTQGDLQQRFISDVEETTNIFYLRIFNLFIPVITTVISTIYLLHINVKVAILVLIMCPLLGIFFEKLRLKMKTLQKDLRESEAGYRNFQQNIVDGIKIILNYQRESYISDKNDSKMEVLKKKHFQIAKLQGFGYGLAVSWVYLVQVVAIIIGFYGVKNQVITAGEMVAIMTLVGAIVGGFANFGRSIAEMQKSLVSANKILQITNVYKYHNHTSPENPTHTDYPIKVQGLQFGYNGKTILANINLRVEKGEKVLIKGKNGEGKSTLYRLILGLFDAQQGDVFVCGEKVDATFLHVHNDLVEWLPTEDVLFTSDIRQNIFWKKEITVQEEEKLLELANLLDFKYIAQETEELYHLPNLSGGEIQKIKLMRCLLNDAEIYLLDEPNKALDQHTRERLQDYLRTHFSEKTILIIDHSDCFVHFVDSIYEMSNGSLSKVS